MMILELIERKELILKMSMEMRFVVRKKGMGKVKMALYPGYCWSRKSRVLRMAFQPIRDPIPSMKKV
jgi:hypothetical protein